MSCMVIKAEAYITVLVSGRINEKLGRWRDQLWMRVLDRGIGVSGLANVIFCGGVVLDVASVVGSHAGGL